MENIKRFKLIDKEGFFNELSLNKSLHLRYFSDDISLPLREAPDGDFLPVNEGEREIVICRSELKYFEEYKDFTINDLVSGKHVVKIRGYEDLCLVLDCGFMCSTSLVSSREDFSRDFKNTHGDTEFDIMEVFELKYAKGTISLSKGYANLIPVWQRENEEETKLKTEILALKYQLKEKEDELRSLK